jgi:hypothetical protein
LQKNILDLEIGSRLKTSAGQVSDFVKKIINLSFLKLNFWIHYKIHLNKIKLICANAFELAHSNNDKPLTDEEKYTRLGFMVNNNHDFRKLCVIENLKYLI